MIDGIDGSGKSTIVNTWKKICAERGQKTFDLKTFWAEHNQHPTLADIGDADIVFSAEPTSVGIGTIIRHELISKNNHYPPLAIVHAFSLDRLIFYHNVIIPLLARGTHIIQDRGISSSLAYQSTNSPDITIPVIAGMPGNTLALTHRPDYLILLDLEAETAQKRLALRSGKQDNAIFEESNFLKQLVTTFRSPEYTAIFETRGTNIIRLSAEDNIDTMQTKATELLLSLLTL